MLKKLISIVLSLFLFACSEKSMQKIGLRKEQADAYTVRKKQPLIMPPDLTLRPPSEASLERSYNKDSLFVDDRNSDITIDEILIGDKSRKNISKVKKKISSSELLLNILKTKTDAILN